MAAMLILAVSSVTVPSHSTAPETPLAYGCNDPPIGGLMAIFDNCAECEMFGIEGANEGMWTTWHCRFQYGGYRLYAT